MVYASRSGW